MPAVDTFEDVLQLDSAARTTCCGCLSAARVSAQKLAAGERSVVVLTSFSAEYEKQIGQIAHASSKTATAGMTLCAVRDLAGKLAQVCSITPGSVDTQKLAETSEPARENLNAAVPHPRLTGDPCEHAQLAAQIAENPI